MAQQARPYPRRNLEQALRVPRALKEYNGGNAWPPGQVAEALGLKPKSGNFFYIAGASRDFGLTSGSRDTTEIALTDLGRSTVYPESEEQERVALRKSALPEEKFLTNTLHQTFGLDPDFHSEFIDLFNQNAKYVGIGPEYSSPASGEAGWTYRSRTDRPSSVIVGEPDQKAQDEHGSPVCFVIMPFQEREDSHQTGFFGEALVQLFTPAATQAGFQVRTAQRQGSDVIQSTIVNELLQADLILADLTEHNPNVLFELGFCMAVQKPVALIRARGTGQIFDVDNMLRVAEYNPNLWTSTVEIDLPRLKDHIKATWDNRETSPTFRGLLETTAG
jgi:hypothetical protein